MFNVGDQVKLSAVALQHADIREKFPQTNGLLVNETERKSRRRGGQLLTVTHPQHPGWVARCFDSVYFEHS